ncbi:hypothetical protein [Maritalea sp. S77]|uniref:hypothetical protein n=1 Tax=Maritalea sp. S77 TaxID=3415125 RepID=UPI003C7E3877
MFKPISGDGNAERFTLRPMPNGVYSIDGRLIPIRDDSARSLNDSKSVVGVYSARNMGVSLGGAAAGMDVKE